MHSSLKRLAVFLVLWRTTSSSSYFAGDLAQNNYGKFGKASSSYSPLTGSVSDYYGAIGPFGSLSGLAGIAGAPGSGYYPGYSDIGYPGAGGHPGNYPGATGYGYDYPGGSPGLHGPQYGRPPFNHAPGFGGYGPLGSLFGNPVFPSAGRPFGSHFGSLGSSGQPGFSGLPGFSGQQGFPSQPGFSGQPAFQGQAGFGQAGQPGLSDQPGFGLSGLLNALQSSGQPGGLQQSGPGFTSGFPQSSPSVSNFATGGPASSGFSFVPGTSSTFNAGFPSQPASSVASPSFSSTFGQSNPTTVFGSQSSQPVFSSSQPAQVSSQFTQPNFAPSQSGSSSSQFSQPSFVQTQPGQVSSQFSQPSFVSSQPVNFGSGQVSRPVRPTLAQQSPVAPAVSPVQDGHLGVVQDVQPNFVFPSSSGTNSQQFSSPSFQSSQQFAVGGDDQNSDDNALPISGVSPIRLASSQSASDKDTAALFASILASMGH